MKWIFQRFFYPAKVCDMPRIQCAACSGFAVRHRPDSLCDMLRIMHPLIPHIRGIIVSTTVRMKKNDYE